MKKGSKHSNETKALMSIQKTGKPSPRKGVKLSEETKEKLRVSHLGNTPSIETRKKMSESMYKRMRETDLLDRVRKSNSGKNNYAWIENRDKVTEKHRLRGTREWREWREKVFKRDNHSCQECGAYGVYLEPHHILPVRSNSQEIFNPNNGITLCRPCHRKTVWKESDFAEKYSARVAAQL